MHRMLTVVALVASAAVPGPAQAQQVSAEKLFQQMEKKLQDAKTVQFGFEIKISGGGKAMGTEKGKVVLGEGDKFRLENDGFVGGKNTTVVADGTKMFIKHSDPADSHSTNCPKNVGAYFRGSWVRLGLELGSFEGLRYDPSPKIAEVLAVSDFKLGAKENINGVETQVIEYKVTAVRADMIFNTKVWVAVETSLPVKLELRFKAMGGVVEFSETYTDWVLDAKLDPKLFQPPQ
jgi:outer membrane lipoprotein-sorting protein